MFPVAWASGRFSGGQVAGVLSILVKTMGDLKVAWVGGRG